MKKVEINSYVPGLSIDEIKEKYGVKNIIKLASNENPYGASPVVQEVIKKYSSYVFRYPRSDYPELTQKIAEHLNIDERKIVVGNGSDELIDLIIKLNLQKEGNILFFSPGFSIYELQAKIYGVNIKKVPLNEDFSFSLEKMLSYIDKNTILIFLNTPYNPSGYAVTKRELISFLNKVPKDIIVVIDEAYIDFVGKIEEYSLLDQLDSYENVVILRTFSKAYGLAGLRLGYGIMNFELAKLLKKARLPFSVNILAEKAGIAALKDKEYYELTVKTVITQRSFLSETLKKYGCTVLPSYANFIMFKPPLSADFIYEELLKRGIIIRSLRSYNIPDWLRVSIGTPKENKIFLKSLYEILKKTGECPLPFTFC